MVSAGDDITFTDTSKVILGTGSDATIEHDGTDLKIVNTEGKTTISNSSGDIDISATATAKKLILNGKAGVDLNFEGSKKIETLVGGAKVTGAFEATTSGTFASLINTGSYSDSSGDIGTAGQILSSTGSGTNWVTEVPLYSWSLEGTAIPSGTAVTVTDGTNITTTWDAANFDLTIATTGVPDGSGAANQVTYWSDTDTLTGAAGFTFAGGATGKVAIAGELEVGGVLTDGTFTGSAGTYTGYTSITSTDFVGALTGNADTATALASSGAIAITGDTASTGGPYTYTSGGALSIATTIADTTVTGKVLTNLPTPTSAAIAASDTILAAMAKLQGQITGIPQGLVYKGTWNASTNTPTLASGTGVTGEFYIVSVAGATNLDGITDWQVGDWAIFVEVGATDTWQKIDNTSAILGSGTANKIAKWTGSNTLATGLIADDGTTVTVGNSGNFVVEGNTTLGDADTDSTTVKGPAVFEETLRINEGISLGAATYGSAGQVLTSGGGAASVNTWTTLTTGTVTSVGLTETGDALTITNSPITSSGNINIAGAGASTDYINGELNLVAFPTLDNYQYWTLSDGTNTTNISTTDTATFTGASGITVAESAGTITITGSAQPGTGTQYTLPVWSTTSSLGDSMVSQNAGGTELTVAGSVTIDSSTATLNIKGSNTGASLINFADAADGNVGRIYYDHTDNFMQFKVNDGAKMLIDSDGNVGINETSLTEKLEVDGAIVWKGALTTSKTSAGVLDRSGDDLRIRAYGATAGSGNLHFRTGGGAAQTDTLALTLDSSQNATFAGDIDVTGTAEVNLLRSGTSTSYMSLSSNSLNKTSNGSPGWMYINGSVVQLQGTGAGGSTVIVGDHSQTNTDKTLSVRCDSNSVSTLAAMSHQFLVAGGTTKRGGIFTGQETFNNATQTTIFTLTSNVLIFDVMLTCKSSNTNQQPVYISKKYSVARTYGQTSPNYFKIIDSGPGGGGGTSVRDFTVDFVGDSTTGLECKITGSGGTTHEVHYTIMIGNCAGSTLGVSGY